MRSGCAEFATLQVVQVYIVLTVREVDTVYYAPFSCHALVIVLTIVPFSYHALVIVLTYQILDIYIIHDSDRITVHV